MDLISALIKDGYLKTKEIISAFQKIKREDFVLPEQRSEAEINAPLPIGHGQTISQPLTVAFMLEMLKPRVGDKILDVGSGSGWTVALLAEIVEEKGKVYGTEIISELKEFADSNISKYNFIESGRAKIFCRDGREGLPEFAPFDKIIISAAAESIPKKLLEQLTVGGRIILPIGRPYEMQDIVVLEKKGEEEFIEKRYPGFIFVPLV